jgi:antirestriction protein ArdC
VPRSAARRSGSCRPCADYIGSWLEALREDNRAIVRAASQASKAADYLLGFVPEPVAGAPAVSVVGDQETA